MNKAKPSIDRLSVIEVALIALIYDNSPLSVFTQLIDSATQRHDFTAAVRQLQL